jgi:hypothetical protein
VISATSRFRSLPLIIIPRVPESTPAGILSKYFAFTDYEPFNIQILKMMGGMGVDLEKEILVEGVFQ